VPIILKQVSNVNHGRTLHDWYVFRVRPTVRRLSHRVSWTTDPFCAKRYQDGDRAVETLRVLAPELFDGSVGRPRTPVVAVELATEVLEKG
jgi:hypothetical protein